MANITKVYLMNTLLEKDYAHTMYFANAAAQQAYFQKRILSAMTFTDFSYQRKDHIIRVPKHIDSLFAAKVNYCMYQNAEYSNKWFYAFITDMKYVDDGRTDVYIKTDCIQTWMFDITVKHSFVEREHAATDKVGDHTIEEGLETGEYAINGKKSFGIGIGDAIIAAVTKTPDGEQVVGGMYHGIYSGLAYIPFNPDGKKLQEFVASYDEDAAADAIVMLFLAPRVLILNKEGSYIFGSALEHSEEPYKLIVNDQFDKDDYDLKVTAEFSDGKVDGYTPRNKKLLCYPYRYMLASNNAGGSAVYKFERFFREVNGARTIIEPSFLLAGCLTPGCSIRLIPQCYNGTTDNDEEGLNMGKYPTLSWTSDAYTNWLTQNSVNIGLQLATGVGQIATGAVLAAGTGGLGLAVGGGQIVGGVSAIAGTLAQVHQQSMVPPQAKGNTNSGDVVTAMGDNEFKIYIMSVKSEYAKIIDEYFDMFGYKCNRVKIPEKNHRESYWYTKTIDANIIGGIPQDDLQTIKDCYNRGITFWKNEEYFRNYSAPNGIV